MKTIFSVLGIIFLVLAVAVAVVVGIAGYLGSKRDSSSKLYVDGNIPPIVSTWSKDELIARASPELLRTTSKDQISQLFDTLSVKLGAFQSYDGAKGQSNMSFTTQGEVTTASYISEATFKNGKAKIQIKLILHEDSWQILGFHVELVPM